MTTTIRNVTMSATNVGGIKSMTLREDFGQPTVVVEIQCTTHSLEVGSIVSSIVMGYSDEYATMMTNGIVKEIRQRRPEQDYVITIHDALIRAVDYLLAPDDPDDPDFLVSNESGESIVSRLLELVGITNYTTEATGFTFGVTEPKDIKYQSAWDEIDNINRICAFDTYVDTAGVTHFTQRDPFPETAESAEHTFTTGDSGDILSIEYTKSDEKIRNRIVVYGDLNQGIHATAEAPSDYLPSGYQKTILVSSELIDTQAMADLTASTNLPLFNRLTQTVGLRAKGIPTIRVRDVVGFTENFIGVSSQKMFVHAAEHLIDRESGYVMDLTLTSPAGIISSGSGGTSSGGGGSSGSAGGLLGDRNNMFGIALKTNSAGIIIGTSNFETSGSPTWRDSSGSGATAITGDPLVFRLDPWNPANNAYCLSTTGLWRTTNIRDNPPAWTNVLTLAQMQTATYGTAQFTATLQLSPNDDGYVALAVHNGSGTAVWFGRTSNAPGGSATWSWTQLVGVTAFNGAPGMLVSQKTTQRVWVSYRVLYSDSMFKPQIVYSSDGGSTFTEYAVDVDANALAQIFIPYGASTDDSVIYIGTESGAGSKPAYVLKTSSGPVPSNFSDITPSIGVDDYGPDESEAFTESPSSSGGNLYLMGYSISVKTGLFKYNGTSWTTLQSADGVNWGNWAGYGFGGWPYNNLQLQVHNAGFGVGHIGSTVDSGVTWTEKTGNLLTLQAGTTTVRWLVPIWLAF